MSGANVPHAADTSPAATLEPAPKGAGSFSPLTAKCAFATRVAFEAGEAAERALLACEDALDQVSACEKNLQAARAQLTDATKKLRLYQRDLNMMASAYIDRLPVPKA